MLPKKEKHKKGLFSSFKFNKNRNKKKDNSKVSNLSEEMVDNSSSAKLGETSIPKTQGLTPKKSIESKTIFLIGSTGKGKSTLANVITGIENKFKESSG